MLQFYVLSILLNILGGYLLLTGDNRGDLEFNSNFTINDETFKLIIGILSVLTGLLKLLSPIKGDVPVLGDLLPSLMGFLCGFILIFEYYRNRSTLEDSEQTEKIDRVLIRNKKIIGVAAIIIAILHFLFPEALLL